MKRIFRMPLIVCLGLWLVIAGCDDPKPKVYRIGILCGVDAFARIADGFITKMAEFGYVEGEDIVYDIHKVNIDPTAEKKIVDTFVADKVDLIFAFPTGTAAISKTATRGTDIPVLFAMTFVEGTNLIEDIRQPGGNITGVRAAGAEEIVRRMEILHQIAPKAKRIYLTYEKEYPANKIAIRALRSQAASMGISLVEAPMSSPGEIRADLQARSAAADTGVDAILIMPDPISHSPAGWPLIREFAEKHRLPIGGGASFLADDGAVFSYVSDILEIGKLAAHSADKILRGMSAGDIPVATPVKSLRINYTQAQKLGLEVPGGLMSIATEIIQ